MKNILTCILFAFCISCSDNKTEVPVSDVVKPQLDALAIGSKVYQTQNLADTNFVFEKFSFTYETDSLYILKYKDLVSREKDTLVFKCDNGKIVKLKSNKNEDDFKVYDFRYFDPNINAFVIACSFYESGNVWLINKATGDSLETIGLPIVSPSKKHFGCASLDLEAAFAFNGLEIFNYDGNSYKLIGTRELTNWGPEKIMWKNDTTLIVRAQESEGEGKYRSYCKALYIK